MQKDWQAFDRKKLHQLEKEENEAMKKTLGDELPPAKPAMIFVYFDPKLNKNEMQILGIKFQGQLQSGGIPIQIFETGQNDWVVSTNRAIDAYQVVDYLHQQPEVMRTTLNAHDRWNLPKFKKEYDEEQETRRKKKEEEERLRKLEEMKKQRESETKNKNNAVGLDNTDKAEL